MRALPARLAVMALMLWAPEAGAQAPDTLRGVVRDSAGRGIAGVVVVAERSGQRAETSGDGRFALRRVGAADEVLQFRRLGFVPEERLWTAADTASLLIVQLSALPYNLSPVIVQGRENLRGNIQGFYRRKDQGQGRFVSAEDIERRQVFTMRDLLRTVPGVRTESYRGRTQIRMRGSLTPPQVFLDGVRVAVGEVDIDLFDPSTLFGVEIYSSNATVPPEFNQVSLSGRSGGAILIWTREGRARPREGRRGANQPSPAAVVAAMLERGEAFTEDQVDTPARPDPSLPIEPVYPDSLFATGTTGFAMVEFVIRADGQMLPETIAIVTATHPLFGRAAQRALLTSRFFPATRQGRRVSQVVQLPIRFTLPQRADARP